MNVGWIETDESPDRQEASVLGRRLPTLDNASCFSLNYIHRPSCEFY